VGGAAGARRIGRHWQNANNGSKRAVGSAAPADATIDPLANPDIDQLQRVSPEALLDLFC